MNLDEAQRKRVAEWIAQGLKLSDIQNKLASELGVNLTYMDVRLLVDDLKLTPKDAEKPKTAPSPLTAPTALTGATPMPAGPAASAKTATPPGQGKVSVTVDQITRAGAVVSGGVTFSDGNKADWLIDQTGRLALSPQVAGYRPPAADVQQFQIAMETELAKLGF